jgi:hypothetical protein
MAAKIEKLARGDPIVPPCDRCRRLKYDCTKHLTACSACTKKHAKCSWKDVKEGELVGMAPFVSVQGIAQSTENGYATSAASLQENSDPGLRTVERGGEGKASLQAPTEELARRPELAADHAVLTQVASTVAAAGTQ